MITTPSRPILRYHGGKWLLAPWIISHFPKHRVYVEPFGGAASVLLRKPRSYAEVYNDLDGEIVNLFRVARDHGQELMEALRLTPFAREEFELSYEPADGPVEQARRTVTRAFLGHGSGAASGILTGFRANSFASGTPGPRDWVNYADAFTAIIDRLRGVVIEKRPALDVSQQHDSRETLHYWDPPYVIGTRDAGSDYRHELTDADHEALLGGAQHLRGYVVISGYDNELYNDLLPGWRKVVRAALADGARKRHEVLWLSPNININPTLL